MAAKSDLQKAVEISQGIGAKMELMSAYNLLAIVHEKLSEFKQGLKYQRLYGAIKDSIFNEEKAKQIELLQAQFETIKKEAEISFLKQDKEIQELSIAKQNLVIHNL